MQVNERSPPWRFFTSYYHDPMLYGYRGLVVEWDYTVAADSSSVATTGYRLNGDDEALFPEEVDYRPDDFHRHYCPYRRLVGMAVVERFNRVSTPAESGSVEMRASSSSLAEFVRHIQGSSYARDQIQPVYRPVAVLPPTDNAAGDYDDQRTRTDDDWYAMVDDRDQSTINHSQQSEYPTTTHVAVVVTPSTPLPVVPEVSAEDHWNGYGTEVGQEPPSQCPVMNGEYHVTGNGKVEHYVGEPDVADDVGVVVVDEPPETSTTTTMVTTHTTIVRHVNGDALNSTVDDEDVVDGDVNNSVCTSELFDNGADAVKTSGSGYIIDESSRRTIRSDL